MMAIEPVSGALNASTISAILNLVCPDCGGSMMAFRCLGKCCKDWRAEWDAAVEAAEKSDATIHPETVRPSRHLFVLDRRRH